MFDKEEASRGILHIIVRRFLHSAIASIKCHRTTMLKHEKTNNLSQINLDRPAFPGFIGK